MNFPTYYTPTEADKRYWYELARRAYVNNKISVGRILETNGTMPYGQRITQATYLAIQASIKEVQA